MNSVTNFVNEDVLRCIFGSEKFNLKDLGRFERVCKLWLRVLRTTDLPWKNLVRNVLGGTSAEVNNHRHYCHQCLDLTSKLPKNVSHPFTRSYQKDINKYEIVGDKLIISTPSTLSVHNVSDLKEEFVLEIEDLKFFTYAPQKKVLCVVQKNSCNIWNPEAKLCMHSQKGCFAQPFFTPKGALILTKPDAVEVWHDNDSCYTLKYAIPSNISVIHSSMLFDEILALEMDGKIRFIDTTSGMILGDIPGGLSCSKFVPNLFVDHQGVLLIKGTRVIEYRWNSKEPEKVKEHATQLYNSCFYHGKIVGMSTSSKIGVWDPKQNKLEFLESLDSTFKNFGCCGERIVAIDSQSKLWMWDLNSLKLIDKPLKIPTKCWEFLNMDTGMLCLYANPTFLFFNLKDGKISSYYSINREQLPCQDMAWHQGKLFLAYGSDEQRFHELKVLDFLSSGVGSLKKSGG